MIFTKKIRLAGGSLGLVVPVDLIDALDINPGDFITVDVVKVIKK